MEAAENTADVTLLRTVIGSWSLYMQDSQILNAQVLLWFAP